ncbi:hypothetical protein OAA91_00475 [Fibrobacterales bacterium]|nr:hypothetical protein [Fibrobacterales bacterium]
MKSIQHFTLPKLFASTLLLNLALPNPSLAADTTGIYMIGHSLVNAWQGPDINVNAEIPLMVKALAEDEGSYFVHQAKQSPPGSPLKSNFNSPSGSTPWNTSAQSGKYDFLLLTEALELRGNIKWNNSEYYTSEFHKEFAKHNPEVETLLYQTWHCVSLSNCTYPETGTDFNSDIDSYLPDWENWADSAAKLIGKNEVRIAPAGLAFKRLNDSLLAGKIPGHTQLTDFFTDNIHQNQAGAYLIAATVYATLFKKSPVGLTRDIDANEWGTKFKWEVSDEVIIKLQEIAWETVCNYPRSGVDCDTITAIKSLEKSFHSSQSMIIGSSSWINPNQYWQVNDMNGKLIQGGKVGSTGAWLESDQWASGKYFLIQKPTFH